MPRDVGVILVAAGQGSRLGGRVAKQFIPIVGVPMVLRALRPFVSHPQVSRVALVLPPDEARTPPDWLADLVGDTLGVVAGGARRQDSVAAGLAALPPNCAIVLVHDGARPFPDPTVIDGVIAAARTGVGAVAGIPVSDTIKDAPDGGEGAVVRRTVPREGLWRAQTPQGFPRALLERAHREAAGGRTATDDAELVERLGGRVIMVPDSTRNVKVTTPADLLLAQHLVERG